MSKNIFTASDIIYDEKIVYIKPPSINGVSQTIDWGDDDSGVFPPLTNDELLDGEEDSLANVNNSEDLARSEELRQEAEEIKTNATEEAAEILQNAKNEASNLIEDAKNHYEEAMAKAKAEGFEVGKVDGFKEGYDEVSRLVERMHVVINKIIDKRSDIFDRIEGQVIELAILMVKKVVKVVSANEKTVIVNNIMQAIKRLKANGDIVVKLNIDDLNLASSQKEAFTASMEKGGNLTFVEDNSIEQGGCIVESEFGGVDARINSQLMEMEDKIRELLPK